MPNAHNIPEISISLLPEFGWAVKDEPVYGPGSVFQGAVHIRLSAPVKAERLILGFRAIESIPAFESCPGVFRFKQHQIFGVQLVLWDSKGIPERLCETTYRFPFTIQMPLVNFPPSADHTYYRCRFELVANLDCKPAPAITLRNITYMPFLETSLLKSPLIKTTSRGSVTASMQLSTLDYVPGDPIDVNVHLLVSKKSPATRISVKLCQTTKCLIMEDVPEETKIVCSAIEAIESTKTISLQIPVDVTPSFCYSRFASVTYKLRVEVERKGLFSSNLKFEDIPVNIGTLGYGIRCSEDLQVYSAYVQQHQLDSSQVNSMPKPHFMRSVEYENALPLYESGRLPSYNEIYTSTTAVV
ncbi:hypothetical protein EC973_004607 [Apophysomyces ossiformis]|uniref:Arrestin C-terminal-like domain-containing protein n=1 Tax=Apophysomyces ossiformis TaxID=679940 RepID=A0A8H7BV10_9FUNG|nr:hypothetical protein EC973_004607 [Apophysomyces ossiformis]